MNAKSDFETGPLVFYPRIPKLLEIAAVNISIELWRRKIYNGDPSGIPSFVHFTDICFYDEKSLGIPRLMYSTVRRFVNRTKTSLDRWLISHKRKIYIRYDGEIGLLRDVYDNIAWYPNGTIDYFKTAENLLQRGKLCVWERYRVCCEYCMEDTILEMKPLLSENMSAEKLSFYAFPMMKYWSCYMEGKLDEFPAERPISVTMIATRTKLTWWAVMYFWKQVPPQHMEEVVNHILWSWDGYCVRDFLPTLDEEFLNRLIGKSIVDIINNLATHYWCIDHALEIWMYSKTMVTKKQFLSIISTLLKHKKLYVELAPLLHEIWISAPDNLKSFVVDNHEAIHFFSEEYLLWFIRDNSLYETSVLNLKDFRRDIGFITRFLACATVEQRKLIFETKWFDFIVLLPTRNFNEIMKSVFSSEDVVQAKKGEILKSAKTQRFLAILVQEEYMTDVDEFLNSFINDAQGIVDFKKEFFKCDEIEEYFMNLIDEGDMERLDDVARFFSNESESALDVKKQMSLSESFIISLLYYDLDKEKEKEKSIENELLEQVYPTSELLLEYKAKVISSDLGLLCMRVLFRHFHFPYVMKLVDSIMPTSQSSDFRKTLSKEYHDMLTNSLYDTGFYPSQTQDFLRWCLGSYEQVTEFKRSLDIEKILRKCLDNIDEFPGNYTKRFLVPNFLLWCWETHDIVRDKIPQYEEILSQFYFINIKEHMLNNVCREVPRRRSICGCFNSIFYSCLPRY